MVDTLGLLLAAVVHPADIQDRDGARLVLERLVGRYDRLQVIWADGAYGGKLVEWAKLVGGWSLELVRRPAGQHTFQVLPRRWVVERTFGWFNLQRRLSDMTIKVSKPDSINSEYAGRDFLCKNLGLSKDDFKYEPNGTTTFPDWSMSWMEQTWNVEVTRVTEQVKKIVRMDTALWPDQVDEVRRSRPRPTDHAKILQRKANRAEGSDTPTILVVFSEIGNLTYEDIDMSALDAVFEIDETTHAWRLIET